MKSKDKVVIIGGGLAGLCCARVLHKQGVNFTLLEASNAVGGRVRTDRVDGYLLDRGFQMFLSAYPEAKSVLNYDALDLRPFVPGAMVRAAGKFHQLSDPFRCPMQAIETLFSSVGTINDKLSVAKLRLTLTTDGKEWQHSKETTIAALNKFGFSSEMIEKFFRPLFAGIFLDSDLNTAASMFAYVFKVLANGDNVLPSQGMQSIPVQIAKSIPPNSIQLNQPVASVEPGVVKLATGEKIDCRAAVIATEEPKCRELLGQSASTDYRSQVCVYFSADEAPFSEAKVVLNGESNGLVTNFVVPSNVSSTYAPQGKALIAAVLVGNAEHSDSQLETAVRKEMSEWFGSQVSKWNHLRTYRINYALPNQEPEALASVERSYASSNRIFVCGDYKETGTINGAMKSGRAAAEALLAANLF